MEFPFFLSNPLEYTNVLTNTPNLGHILLQLVSHQSRKKDKKKKVRKKVKKKVGKKFGKEAGKKVWNLKVGNKVGGKRQNAGKTSGEI